MTILGFNDLAREQVRRGGLAANNVKNILADYFLNRIRSSQLAVI